MLVHKRTASVKILTECKNNFGNKIPRPKLGVGKVLLSILYTVKQDKKVIKIGFCCSLSKSAYLSLIILRKLAPHKHKFAIKTTCSFNKMP